jgi:hypothetical protein
MNTMHETHMIRQILIGLAALVFVLVVVATPRQVDCLVERSATLSTRSAAVFGQLKDLHKFTGWNPLFSSPSQTS